MSDKSVNNKRQELDDLSKIGAVSRFRSRILGKQKSLEEVQTRIKVERTKSTNPFAEDCPPPLPRRPVSNVSNISGSSSARPEIQIQDQNEKCVQLYKCEGGKYFLDMKTMEGVFGKVKDKLISIYSIAGKYRSGKSFILSIFLKYLKYGHREDWIDFPFAESFKYQSTDKRVTTGIWISSEPIMKKTQDGRDVAVFLIDTQGWHDDQTNSHDSSLVFALSALLSSVMIYNTEKRIGEDDLHYFQYFSTHAKLLDAKNNDEPFQKLLFLIRDWQFTSDEGFPFGYYDDQTSIDCKNFKTERIDARSSQSPDARSVRDIISNTYDDISAYLMPYPGSGIQSDNFWSCAVDQIFVEHLTNFTSLLFRENAILPKRIGGKLVTGRELIAIAQTWTMEFKYEPCTIYGSLINAIPRLKNSANDETQYQMAFQTSLDYFDEKIKKYSDKCQTIEQFEKLLNQQRNLMQQCEIIFHASKKLSNDALKKKYSQMLKVELNEREKSYQKLIGHEIELKRTENIKIAKQNELAELVSNYDIDAEDNIYGEYDYEIKELEKFAEEKKELIRETKYDVQEARRKQRKSWFTRMINRIAKAFI